VRNEPARAGRSALECYRTEVRERRRAFTRCAAATFASAGLGWLALRLGGDAGNAAFAGAIVLLVSALWMRPRPDPERWLRGAAGEVATARMLECLPDRKWVVLHDLAVPGSRSNVDHLVIGPTGVWVVDSKTKRGRARRGLGGVRFGDHRLDTGPVRFEASVVEERLGVRVRAVVAVHGAGLPRRGVRSGGVRVVPAGSLIGLLTRPGWPPWRRRCRRSEVRRLARLAESQLAPARCSSPYGGWYRSKRDPREPSRQVDGRR